MEKQFLNSLKFKKFGERSFHHHLDPFLVRLSVGGHFDDFHDTYCHLRVM